MTSEQFDILVEDISVGLGTLGADVAIAASNDYDASELTVAPLLIKRIHQIATIDGLTGTEQPLFHMYNDGTVTTSQFAAQFLAANPTQDRTTSAGTKELWWETLAMLWQTGVSSGVIDKITSMMGGKGAYCNQDQGFSSHVINRSGSTLTTSALMRGHGVYNVVWM